MGVGQAMERQQPASGEAIDEQLHRATSNLDGAAALDSKQWGALDSAAHNLLTALEAGKTPNGDVVVELTNGCQQFAGTSASNAG